MNKPNNLYNELKLAFTRNKTGEKKSKKSASDIFLESTTLMLDTFKNLPDFLFLIDRNMKVLWANNNLLERYPELVGQSCPVLCSSSDILHVSCYCRKAMESGQIQRLNIYIPEAKGIYENDYWEGTGIPLKNETGIIVGAIGLIKNISNFIDTRAIEFLTSTGKKLLDDTTFTESAYWDSTGFYSSLVHEMNAGIAIINNFNQIKYWNSFMQILTGVSPQEAADMKIDAIISNFGESQLSEGIEKSTNGGIYFIQNDKIKLAKSGKEFWINGDISPIFSKRNNRIGSIITIKYYTQQDKKINEPEYSGEILRALIDCSPAAIVVSDKDSKVKMWNPAAENMFGWMKNEVIDKTNPIVNMDNLAEYAELFQRVMQGHTLNNMEIIREQKNGAQIYVSLSASPLRDTDGEIIGVVGILSDINDRKFSEEALAESEVKYKSFVQNFQGIAYRLLQDKKLVFINGAVETITGYAEEEFRSGKIKWRDLILPEDIFHLTEQDAKIGILPGFELDVEYRIRRKDNSIRWIHEFLQNITDRFSKVIYIQGTFQDVTQRKEAEEELKRSREHLRNLALHLETLRENEKKHIAFEIHDELGHALTALKLELSWIVKKRHLRQEVMFEKVKKMSDLIDSTIRKVRSISSELRPSVLDHFGLVAAIEWQVGEFQKRSAVRCRMNISQTDIKLDENRSITVFRTLQEVLTNVARHAQATRVDVNLDIIDDYLQLRVSDNGKGIKQEQINNKKSFGLIGMFERASALGGKVSISGVIGIGTTVTLQLPLTDKVIT